MPVLLFILCLFFISEVSAQEYTPRPHCGTHLDDFKNTGKIPSARKIQVRPGLSHRFLSPSGKFLIHYDIAGPNAVPLKDDNANSVPDFVDSAAAYFEYAYQVEVNEIGYRPPPKDTVNGDAFDVYLMDNIGGNYYYGLTHSDERFGQANPAIYTSYIIIDNDFSPKDSIQIGSRKQRAFFDTGYAALKAIAAHEFHHAIQFGYSYSTGLGLFYEMSSTWMEYRVHPDLRIYEEFLPALFKNLSQYIFSDVLQPSTGYAYSIFGQYIHARYGDGLLKRTWEIIGTDPSFNPSPYNHLDSAFKEQGSTLPREWCGFLPWIYFTGNRAEDGKFFKNARLYPEVRFFYDSVFTKPSTTVSGFLQPYELRFLRVILPESSQGASVTADIALANIDTEALVHGLPQKQHYSVIVAQAFEPGFKNIPGTSYFLKIEHTDNICDTIFVSGSIRPVATAYPNPFKIRTDFEAFFPAPAESIHAGSARLILFKSDMQQVYSGTLPVEIIDEQFAVRWTEIPESLASGVYIFSVESGDERSLGKIVIQR